MSRTIRRKNFSSECYFFAKSEEEFMHHKEAWTKQKSRPELALKRPELQYDVCPKEWEAYWAQYRSEQWVQFYKGRKYTINCRGQSSYNKYKKVELARFHADMGSGRQSMWHGPRWYVKAFITRPLRQKHREEIYRGVMYDGEHEVVLTPNKKCSSMYW